MRGCYDKAPPVSRRWPRSSASSEGHDKTLVIEHPEEVFQSRCAVTIKQCFEGARGALLAGRVSCYACTSLRCSFCSRCACTYSGGDPEHRLIPISSCCGSRPSKAAISLRALVPPREVSLDSTVASKNFVQVIYSAILGGTFTPQFWGVLLLRNFGG